MEKINNVGVIPKFNYTLGMLPTSFLESMTYQEQLNWLCNYFNQTIHPTLNDVINGYNETLDAFNSLSNEFTTLSNNVTETLNNYDSRITNGLTAIETALSAELPALAESVISAKIQAGELNCQLGTSYNSGTQELTFTIQIVEGD